jgi:cytochrome c oxidase subunit 2
MRLSDFLCLPVQASERASAIDTIIEYVHWLMLLLFLGWGFYFIYTLFRFRASKNPKASYKGVQNHFSSYIEIAIVIAEVVLLVGISIPFWSNVILSYPDKKESTIVRVVAQQFAWNVHYPGEDGKFGKTSTKLVNAQTNPIGLDSSDPNAADDYTTVNQLNVPVNTPLIVELSSLDVIHSFGIPEMRVKQDVLPGIMVPTWFKPIKEGTFEIMCAQLCGIGHYRMKGYVNVMSPAKFDEWKQAQAAAVAETESADGDDFWG